MDEIRNLTLDDVIPVMRVCNQAFLEDARSPRMGANVVRYVREHPDWQWGALAGGQLLGFLLTEPSAEKGRVAIRLIAADPAIQGRGTGGRLLATLAEKARSEGLELLSVGTPFAHRFYEKYGFKVTAVSLKMVREIIQQAIPRPEGVGIETLDYESAATVLPELADDEARARFLSAFMGNYRAHRGLALRATRDGKTLGVAIGGASNMNGELAHIAFRAEFGDGFEALVRSFEYTASTLGYRYVGFSPPAEEEQSFESLGYRRSEMACFWTMYTLERALAGDTLRS